MAIGLVGSTPTRGTKFLKSALSILKNFERVLDEELKSLIWFGFAKQRVYYPTRGTNRNISGTSSSVERPLWEREVQGSIPWSPTKPRF